MNDLTIVTAASSNHFGPLLNLLYTIGLNEPGTRVVAWDVGLTDAERAWFASDVPAFSWPGELRRFDFAKHPPHFGMDQFAGRLAWRQIIVAQALEEFGGKVLWLDAGCWVRGRLTIMRRNIAANGVACRSCYGTIGDHLWPSSWPILGATEAIRSARMVDAGVVGFDSANPRAVELVRRWAQVALDPAAVGPDGSDRRSHRQDAVFGALFRAAGFAAESFAPGEVAIKRDRVSFDETRHRMGPPRMSMRQPPPPQAVPQGYARAILATARGIR